MDENGNWQAGGPGDDTYLLRISGIYYYAVNYSLVILKSGQLKNGCCQRMSESWAAAVFIFLKGRRADDYKSAQVL